MKHVGFIMDGNRTWAKERWLETFEWHKVGYENMEAVIDGCLEKWVEYVSFWALSDDNIRERSALELKYLFDLLADNMSNLVEKVMPRNIRLEFVGDRNLLRKDCREALLEAENTTKQNTGMVVIVAIGYGWQEEIVRGVQKLAREWFDFSRIQREDILHSIDTGKFPPVDLIVRTGGHIRHSGYFLFQSPYAEYFFSQKNWPAFDSYELDACFESYASRKRKFGK